MDGEIYQGKVVVKQDYEVIRDNQAVLGFARKMKDKMAKSRAKGRSGWDQESCSSDMLAEQFWDHLEKTNAGNFVDLANYLMMLEYKGADPSILVKWREKL